MLIDSSTMAVKAVWERSLFARAILPTTDGSLCIGDFYDMNCTLDGDTLERITCFSFDCGYVRALATLTDGRLVGGGTLGLSILDRRYNIAYCKHFSSVTCMLSLPFNRLACGSADGSLSLHTIGSNGDWHDMASIQVHDCPINALALLDDGRIATASDDCTIKLLDGEWNAWFRRCHPVVAVAECMAESW